MKSSLKSISKFPPYYSNKVVQYCTTLLFILTSLTGFGQKICEDYQYALKHAKEMTFNELDELQTALAEEDYWFAWYNILRRINIRNSASSPSEALLYLNAIDPNTIDDFYIKGKYYRLKSYTHKEKGNIHKAIVTLEKAYDLFRLTQNDKFIGRCLLQFSYLYSLFNDHHTAIDYGNQYIDHLDIKDSVNLSKAHKNLYSYHFYARQYSKALEHNDKALNFNKKYEAEAMLNTIKTLIALNEFSSIDLLLRDGQEKFGNVSAIRNELKTLEADFYSKCSKFEESIALKKSLLVHYDQQEQRREEIRIRQSLARDYFQIGAWKEALYQTHQVQEFFCSERVRKDIEMVPDSSALIPEAWLMESLLLKAEIFEKSSDPEHHNRVLHTYEKAMYVLDLLRDNYKATGSIFDIGAVDFSIFEHAIQYCWNRYEESGKSLYLNKAFYYTQLAKSYTLRKSRSFREILERSSVPKKIQQTYLDYLILAQQNIDNKNEVYDSIDFYYQVILDYFPQFKSKSSIQLANIKEVQRIIDDQTAVLHFFVGQEKLYIYAINKKEVLWEELVKPNNLNELLDTYHRCLKDADYLSKKPKEAESQYLTSASELYHFLFSSVEAFLENDSITHLTIVPDDFLHEISFESLPIAKDSSWLNTESYLIQQYALHHLLYAGELLSETYGQEQPVENASIFGISYEDYPDSKFQVLNSTIEESQLIAKRTGGQLFNDHTVHKSTFLEALEEKDLLHFSGHSIHDTFDYTQSYLPMYEGNRSAGNLYYHDVVATTCNAALVSLSACHTVDGQKERTEGLISLTRAFKESGAQACIGSLWNASDQSSKEILEGFYRHISEGKDKATALQTALLEYLNDPQIKSRMKAPFYWSNWKLYGNPATIHLSVQPSYPLYYFLLALLIALAGYFFIKRFLSRSRK